MRKRDPGGRSMTSSRRLPLFIGILILLMITGSTAVLAQEAVVNAVLFFSPTCPACHQVMNNDLPPLKELYGERLQILEVNVTSADGQRMYNEYIQQYNVPDERVGVPALVVGDLFMVGAAEIPQFFPSHRSKSGYRRPGLAFIIRCNRIYRRIWIERRG